MKNMNKVALTIDGSDIIADRGKTILEVALQNGIYIPHLCYHPDLKPAGACRLCIVELLIANHHADCRNCPSSGKYELQRIMAYLHLSVKRMRPLRWAKEELPRDVSNLFFDYDPNKCVLCGICVCTCEDVQGVSALQFVGRGYGTKIAFFGDKFRCESCGECVVRCPIGALAPKDTQCPTL
jgi:formate dehydrogenase major subunit